MVTEGKTKKIYLAKGSSDLVTVVAKDDITAGDGAKHDIIPDKGRLATATTSNVFRMLKACGLPVFFPSSAQEILDLGLHAYAMSRFSGLWAGMKVIQEVVESSSSVSVEPDRVQILLPEDFAMPPGGLHIRWPDVPLEQEEIGRAHV